MKKIIGIFAFVTALLVSHNVSSQFWEDEEPKPDPMLKKGDFMVTGFGSYPNFGRFMARLAIETANFNVTSSSTGGFAPLGVQGEFMLTNNFAISLDLIANQWSARWTEFSPFDNQVSENSVSVFRFRGLLGLNYHIDDFDNEKLNIYGGFALGYNYRKSSIKISDFNNVTNFWDNDLAFPMAIRFRAGLRYFLNDNLGLNVELGAGGPIMRLGVTVRIPEQPNGVDRTKKM